MIFYYIIEKKVFEKTVFAFNSFNDYTLQRSDFEFNFIKNDVEYVAALCDEAYILDESIFIKKQQSELDSWLINDILEITPRQFDLQLIEDGLYAQVQNLISRSSLEVQIWYKRSTIIKITNPILNQLAQILGKDDSFLREFFKKASNK